MIFLPFFLRLKVKRSARQIMKSLKHDIDNSWNGGL